MKSLFFFCFIWCSASFAEVHAILLAGGGGTRLWPLSTQACPKQFIDFGDGESLLQKTIQRLLLIEDLQTIVISTSQEYEPLVQKQIEPFSHVSIQILVEPERKNTAAAIALACKHLMQNANREDAILVVPSDHLIGSEKDFVSAIEAIIPTAALGKIITFGIEPTKPETGYGYLQLGDPFDHSTYVVQKFMEKPTKEKAIQLIESENVYWNSGIFAFTLSTFCQELVTHAPEIGKLLFCPFSEIRRTFSEMPDISIDFAVMEKSKAIVAYPLQIQWSDIGSWDSLYEISEKDENGNVLKGNVSQIGAKNSLIFSQKRRVAAIEIEDLLIIETDDTILIGKRGESQKVKALLEKLK